MRGGEDRCLLDREGRIGIPQDAFKDPSSTRGIKGRGGRMQGDWKGNWDASWKQLVSGSRTSRRKKGGREFFTQVRVL